MPYKTQSADTSIEFEKMQFAYLRRLGRKGRLENGLAIVDESADIMEQALRRLHPEWTPEQLKVEWIRVQYGEELALKVAQAKYLEIPPTLVPKR